MPVGEKVAVSGSRRDMNITFLCPCWRLSPPEDSLEEMNYHDGENRPDEGSDQRDMRRWDLEVLIPGEWNKGDENPDANEGDEKSSKKATRGGHARFSQRVRLQQWRCQGRAGDRAGYR